MLEVLEITQTCDDHLEKHACGLIVVADKIHPRKLSDFTEKFYAEKCFFRGKDGLNIEIVHHTSQQRLAVMALLELEEDHNCEYELCPGRLKLLGLIFGAEFVIEKDSLIYTIQMTKIYPLLLACLRQCIVRMPLYFTMSSIRNYGTA